MNGPLEPLAPDVVDALLSADLDDQLDAAARDHDLDTEAARARLAVTPGADERRAALERARDTLAVPALDPAARARLLDTALEPARRGALAARRARRSPSRVLQYVAAAAAAVLLLVGVGVTIASMGSSNDADDSASGAAGSDTSTQELTDSDSDGAGTDDSGAVADAPESSSLARGELRAFAFGEIADEQQLRARVGEALSAPPASTAGGDASQESTGTTTPDAALTDCAATQASSFDVQAPPIIRGPVVYQGVSGEVYVFVSGSGYLAVTAQTPDCQLLVSQFLASAP